jgi:hypothetical protein
MIDLLFLCNGKPALPVQRCGGDSVGIQRKSEVIEKELFMSKLHRQTRRLLPKCTATVFDVMSVV